ncbi:MAG: segregation/condensation protein A [Erysipelotrichia bacterium]|nr:segregation/condensation protein A [Erysipelotrichia bacterium]
MSAYQVKLPVFEGPFDLLYHLIEEQKINIYDIPIANIAAQYLEYLQMMEILDMEVASGFLVMAATLLEIKSKMLLPKEKPEDVCSGDEDIDESMYEEDARAGLVEKLLEYRKFKMVALELREMERNASRIFTRSTDLERQPEEILEINIGAVELLNIYHALVRRRISPPIHRVVLEKIGILDRINEIRDLLKKFKGEVTFQQILKKGATRYETVLSFMAVLEMTKTGELTFVQTGNFQPIVLKHGRHVHSAPRGSGGADKEEQPDKFENSDELLPNDDLEHVIVES